MTNQPESNSKQSTSQNRRRRLLIDKPFQYRLVLLLLSIWTANTIFFSAILYFFYSGHILRFYELQPREGLDPTLSTPALFVVAIVFLVVFGIIMVSIVGLYLSHQIAGPLYRIKMSLNRISEGDINFEVRFRDRDFLEDFPGYFNNMLRALKEQSASDLETLKNVQSNLEDKTKVQVLVRALCEKKESQLGFQPEMSREQGQRASAVH